MDKRIIFTASGLHIRESQVKGEESRIIEGRAVVFNEETVLYDSPGYREIEKIAPSCVTSDFLATQDVKLNMLHDRVSTLARSNRGKGTLEMEVREDGLYVAVEAPKCDLGDRALALVANGTYIGFSFEFWPGDYTVEERSGNDYVVTHTRFERLSAITIAMDPAYENTSIKLREEWQKEHGEEPEDRKQLTKEAALLREQRLKYLSTFTQ